MTTTTPAGTITGLLIATDGTLTTVQIPLTRYDDDGYTEISVNRRAVGEMIGAHYVEHFPVKYPASDPDGIGAFGDEEGRINGQPANRIARKVIAELNGMSEAEIVSVHGAIVLLGWTRGDPQDVSLGADQIEEITAIAARVATSPDLPDTEAQITILPWDFAS